MAPVYRLFLSSPGDALIERRRAENVVSRINGEFADLARLDLVRWETEFYKAHATFQEQIPPAADCDLVVGILRWRLGTELPPEFEARLPDGEPYPSGTAYELLSAIEKRKRGSELPDVFIFRFAGGSPNPRLDDPERARIERDWGGLRNFIERWFVTRRGQFLAALNNYETEDQFEKQLEALLRKWLAEKVSAGRVTRWPASKGSPFRGLGVFGAKHSPVFFGRSTDVRRATDLWRQAASRGAPFLLILGASGAGKSSMARAGLIPRLTTPGVTPDVDLWRVAAMRPGDSKEGPFLALAHALLLDERSLPPEEESRGPALPEIVEGDWQTPAELALLLAEGGRLGTKPIEAALDRIGERARASDGYRRFLNCNLVLLIDQLEELFAPSIGVDARRKFAELLMAILGTGRVWVLATIRADFYGQLLENPGFRDLKDRGASYDLAPPDQAALAEIVRGPAEAAGLIYQTDPESHVSLDERLLGDAERPDMLPLVQLALSRVYEARVVERSLTILPFAAYRALGGLQGIIDEAGETALAHLGESGAARLPRLIRQVAELSRGDTQSARTLTVRAVSYFEAAADSESRDLIEALVAARLLTLSGEGDSAQIRLAHQRVISDWSRAARIAEDSASFYRIRDLVEEQRRRWEEGGRRKELLLARGLPLAEAQNMVATYMAELSPQSTSFIAASHRRAQRAQVLAWSLAAVFAALAIGAGGAAKIAVDQRALANRNLNAAKQTVDGLIFDIAGGLRNVSGMRVETVRSILDTVKATVDRLYESNAADPQLRHSKAAMLGDFARIYLRTSALKEATSAAQESLALNRALVAQFPTNRQARRELSVALQYLGMVKLQAGDNPGALAAFQEELDVDRKLATERPQDASAQDDYASSLSDVADVELQAGDQAGALRDYEAGLAILHKLTLAAPDDDRKKRDLSLLVAKLGDVKLQSGDSAGALAAYREGQRIALALVGKAPDDVNAQRDVAIGYEQIGAAERLAHDSRAALASYEQALLMLRKLSAVDPLNAYAQRDVTGALLRLGDMKSFFGDWKGALASYSESLDLTQKLASQDPSDAQAQRDLSVALDKRASMKLESGERAGALDDNERALEITRKLAARDPENAFAQRDLATNLLVVGGLKLLQGDKAGALSAYQECLLIRRHLLQIMPSQTQPRLDMIDVLNLIAGAESLGGQQGAAISTLDQADKLARNFLASAPGDERLRRALATTLEKSGDAHAGNSDLSAALSSYKEALDLRRSLAQEAPRDADSQRDLGNDWLEVGDLLSALGRRGDALGAYGECIAIRHAALAANGAPSAAFDLEIVLDRSSGLKAKTGDEAGAAAGYREEASLAREFAARSKDPATEEQLISALDKLGDLTSASGDIAGALVVSQEQVAAAKQLVRDSGQTGARRILSVSLNKLGDAQAREGDKPAALASYQSSLTLANTLAASAPDDLQAQRDLEVTENKVGDAETGAGNVAGALAAFDKALGIARRIAAANPVNQNLRDLLFCMGRMADSKVSVGDFASAVTLYREQLDLSRSRAARTPEDAEAEATLAFYLEHFGDMESKTGNNAAALTAYQEELPIRRALAARNPNDADAQIQLVLALYKSGRAAGSGQARPLLSEAFAILQALQKAGKLPQAQEAWLDVVGADLAKSH